MKQNNAINRKELEDIVKSYAELLPEWDGYHGETPKEETIKEALHFITLIPEEHKLPRTSVAGDGEVIFYWQYGQELYLELGFYGEDIYSYIFNSHKPNVGVDGVSLKNDGIPSDLMEYISIF